jgi:hypothetical protein
MSYWMNINFVIGHDCLPLLSQVYQNQGLGKEMEGV